MTRRKIWTALAALALSGCGYFLPTGESAPAYCYRTFTGEHGTEMWSCGPGAEYPRDTLPDALKPSAPTDCITDTECAEAYPGTYGDPITEN